MKTTLVLIGAVALAGVGMALASGDPQQPGAVTSPPQPAPVLKKAAPAPTAEPAAPLTNAALTPEQKAVADAVGAFAKAYSAADSAALADLFVEDVMLVDPEGTET